MAPVPTTQRPLSFASTRAGFASGLVIVAAAALAYLNTVHAPFVYDDTLAIPENTTIRNLWALRDVLVPSSEGGLTTSGRPILNLSFAINYAISGAAPWSYHLLNLAIHAGAGLVLFGLVRRTLHLAGARTSATAAVGRLPATSTGFFVALLWVLHPIQTEAVTYTVQRAESLTGFFYLLTVYGFACAVSHQSGPPEPHRATTSTGFLIVSVLSCALGMATKEIMATAPLLVLLYDRTFVTGTFREAFRQRRGYYVVLAATWILLAVLIASTGGNRGGTVGVGTGVPLWAYPLTQAHAIVTYLRLALWPAPLVFEYGTFWAARGGDVLPYAAVVLPLLVATIVALWRAPVVGFCGAWFFFILAPTSLAPGTLQMIVEHRMYLSLAAILALVVAATIAAVGRHHRIVLAVAAAALGALTIARNHTYRSHLALWSDTVAKRPENARARVGLAEAYEELGRTEDAIAQRREIVRLQPQDPRQHYNLGNILAQAGRLDEAIQQYMLAVRWDPSEPNAHNNLAIALGRAGRLAEALPEYAAAVRLAPQDARFHYNFGVALMGAGQPGPAAREFETTVRLQPNHADAHFNLGSALLQLTRMEEAIVQYSTALDLRPGDAEFRRTLSRAHAEAADSLVEQEKIAEATRHYETAVKLEADDPIAHHNLGVTYARQGRWADAGREFETALRLRPDYTEAQRHLQQVRTLLGR